MKKYIFYSGWLIELAFLFNNDEMIEVVFLLSSNPNIIY